MKCVIVLLFALIICPVCLAEDDGDCVYRLYDENGEYLTSRAGRMYEGDEYISTDNRHFRVTRVDDAIFSAYAEIMSDEISLSDTAYAAENTTHKICMYSTHSDESYIDGDGKSSKLKDAGIYDVGEAFQDALEDKNIDVEYSDETFFPHDAGAYSRSRPVAEELLKESPDALFDIHRDGVAAEEYESEVDGEETSMVRLFVGKSNQNSAENMAFAKKIKAAADKKYPGLIKDIYIGRGNYNQELYPRALLLEFGTHKIDKDLAIKATGYMADIVNDVLYGDSASAAETPSEMSGAAKGVLWALGIAVIAAVIYALASTGRLSDMWRRLSRTASEITGGTFGKRK